MDAERSERERMALRVAFGGVAALAVLGLIFLGIMIIADPGDNLVILRSSVTASASGARAISGIVENRVDRPYSAVEVRVEVLDEQGRVVERTGTVRAELGAGERWEFEAPLSVRKVADYRAMVFSPENIRP